MESIMKVSVILPTYRREGLLCQTIDHVLKQDFPDFELLVLDQSPTHEVETKRFLDSVASHIRYIHLEKPGVVAACNEGVRNASGEILLFIDDDISIPDNKLLERHARNYEDSMIGGVAGKILDAANPIESTYNSNSFNWKWGFLQTSCDHNIRTETVTAQGANMSFRKSAVLEVGGFDENYDGNAFRWETDFCYRLKKAGYITLFDPDALVLHHFNSPGGNENLNLFGRSSQSHGWYYSFFKNTFYFFLKNIGGAAFLTLVWKLYRGHVLNRPYVQAGLGFEIARHRVFFKGLRDGIATYLSWKNKS
jgi:glycosyltransferase involved in cell wall biosynthesis